MRHKHYYLKSIYICILLSILVSGVSFSQKNPKDTFDYQPLNKIKMPKIEEVILTNGMRLLLVEDHDFPTIDLRAMIRTGSVYEPVDKIGLASITGTVIRTGGSKKFPGDDLDTLLETLGATVETSIGGESGYVYVSLLKEDVDQGLDVIADLLMHPVFPDDKIDLAKIMRRSAISRRNDDVGQITNREFTKLIYGAESPYARHPEYVTIDAITRDDIIAFHRRFFHPNNVILAAWGDFSSKDLAKRIEAVFAAWPKAELQIPPKPRFDYTYDFSVNAIEKPDVNQSNIMLGHIGGTMDSPDYAALVVMNQILSYDRMFKRIRTDEGLAYDVWGSYGAGYDHPGVFSCGCQTKSVSTVKAIRIMLEEIQKIRESEVTDDELTRAKDSYLNGFVFNFDSKAKIVSRLMAYDYHDYPRDFMDRVKEGVEKTTEEDVRRVAQEYLKPDLVRILVVGKQADFDEPLSVLGSVNTIDITIPAPKAEEVGEATPEARAMGQELLTKSIEASGGADVFENIRNMRVRIALTQVSSMGEMSMDGEIVMAYPDKLRASLTTPGGEVAMVLNGDEGWMASPQGTMPLPEMLRQSLKQSILRDPVTIFTNHEVLQVRYAGKQKLEEKETEDIIIESDGYTFHLLLDPSTYLPAAYVYSDIGQQGPSEKTEILYDYRTIDGVLVPMRTVGLADGSKESETVIKEVKFNVELAPGVFEKE